MIYILDLETNGLVLNDVSVTQVAYLKLDPYLNVEEEYNRYFYTNNLKRSADITGLTPTRLANLSGGQELPPEILSELMKEIEHGIIIGQNIYYDLMVLDALTMRNGMHVIPKYPLDISAQYSPEDSIMNLEWIVNNHMDSEGAKILENRFKGQDSQYHDALYDIYSVYAVIKNDPDFKGRLRNYLKTVPRKE